VKEADCLWLTMIRESFLLEHATFETANEANLDG
jgi:hypothetical protein